MKKKKIRLNVAKSAKHIFSLNPLTIAQHFSQNIHNLLALILLSD